MESLSTLPRTSWSERSSFALGCLLTLIGALTCVGWLFRNPLLIQIFTETTPIRFNGALSLLLIGIALLGIAFRSSYSHWIALAPGLLNLLTLIQEYFNQKWQLESIFIGEHILNNTTYSATTPTIITLCLGLTSLTLLWQGFSIIPKYRPFTMAVVGSVCVSVGLSTLLGYAASLPAVYMWGTTTAAAPVTAGGLLLTGLALLVISWRESSRAGSGPPRWAPMPAVISCLTLTLVLWIGLREREFVYLGAKTQSSVDRIAIAINSEFEKQTKDIEKLARRWGDINQSNPVIWEADAHTQMTTSQELGGESISYVNTNLRTIWVYPMAGNEAQISFDHSEVPQRNDALQASIRGETAGVKISATTDISGKGDGVVIYAPIRRNGNVIGFVASEYIYTRFAGAIIGRQQSVAKDYLTSIKIGGEVIYDSYPSQERQFDSLTLEKNYTLFDKRLRISMTPTSAVIDKDRRYLPELALVAGFGITILLGLSVSLARSARAGQRTAEDTNQKLLSENEERRRIEARLKISDERLRLALDSTQIGIFEWNVTVGHVHYSLGLWAMLGYEHSRMPATVEAWQSLIHPDDLALYRRRTESQLSGVATFIDPEYRVRTRNGDWRWVYTRSKTISTAQNRPTRIMGTVQDTTARREAEQALRESQAEARKLSLVAAKTDNAVIIGSPHGSIEWINESFTRIMEYSLEEVSGKNPADFMAGPDTNSETVLKIRAAMARGEGLDTDVVNYSKSGRKYHLNLEIQPIYNDENKLENFIAIMTDITVRVDSENQLRRAKSEADAASRTKSEFLASMSHEIRTPMNGVIGMTSLLMETELSGEQRDFVNTIRTSGEALLTIINDILDFSKIESGKMELETMPFDLSLCIEEAFDLFAIQASAKKLELTYHIANEVPVWIIGDVTRLRQIIVNLVNNAVKFTPSGSIAVVVKSLGKPMPSGEHMIEFTIQDSGIGIPEDRLDRLFKAFSQVDSSTTRKYGGTGLGLAISQRLSQLMGGDVRVESKLGEGSSFIFSIETKAAKIPFEETSSPMPLVATNGTVLCIEDHPVTRAYLKDNLKSWGLTCEFASDANEAVALAAKMETPPSLLIIDGDETENATTLSDTAEIKVPRILMIPFGQSAPLAPDELPFVVLYKPPKVATIKQAIMQVFRTQGDGHKPVEERKSNLPLAQEFPLNILLVEDNAVNQKVALRFLQRIGYRADAVGNGLEAVTTLESRRYDLVFMDLQMPIMDGIEASRQIRRRLPADQQPKIVALTANAMQGDRELCLSAGMDDYISKPVKFHEIEDAIRRQFGSDGKASSLFNIDKSDTSEA